MTLLDIAPARPRYGTRWENGVRARQGQPSQGGQQQQEEDGVNVSRGERATSIAAGSVLALLGLGRRGLPGLLAAGVGGALLYRGSTGHCPAYAALGMNTAQDDASEQQEGEHAIHVEQSFLINRPAEQLYSFWRNFENLPRFLSHIDRIEVQSERRSHWVARLSRLAGGKLEWDAEITREDPNSLIAWRSLPGSDIDTTGQVRFNKAMGDRGTEMHVFMDFTPPAGAVAGMFPSLFNKATRRMIREDLRRFKQLMELGEIPTIDGQPHGTCTGHGTRYRDT